MAESATFGVVTALSRRSTVRTVPSTICAERTLFLAMPTARALAGQGQEERHAADHEGGRHAE
jgi:hypothetical protein